VIHGTVVGWQYRWLNSTTSKGVAFLHGLAPSIIHQGLKSSNVVLDEDRSAKICDFGLTKLTQRVLELDFLTRLNHGCEACVYVAPELFDADKDLTDRSDVWALGCVVVETLTGRLPCDGEADVLHVARRIVLRRQLPFSDWTGLPSGVQMLAEQAFSFDPTERIDAVHFLKGLNDCAPV